MFCGKVWKRLLLVVASAGLLLVPLHVLASNTTTATDLPADLIISELKVNNDKNKNGYNEFIELYNNSATSLNLANYNLVYFNATDPGIGNVLTNVPIVKTDPSWLPAHSNFVLANSDSTLPIAKAGALSFALSDSGGQVMVLNPSQKISDKIIWTGTKADSSATILYVSSSTNNQSWQRGFDDSSRPLATETLAAPTPNSVQLNCDQNGTPPVPDAAGVEQCQAAVPPDQSSTSGDPPATDPASTDNPIALPDQSQLLPPQITELLPNPAAPQTDNLDEFVELYNPNGQAFDLKGYTLESGTTTLHDFTFTDSETIAPNSYEAFYSRDTNLSLSNTRGQVRLLDPGQHTVSQTDVYATAKDGYAWAYVNNIWQWTTTPTPGAVNNLNVPVVVKASTATAAKTTAKKTAKVKGASTIKTKKSSSTSGNGATSTNASTVLPTPTIHGFVLAAVGVLALLYVGYEYRQDLANKFYQFRQNRSTRRTTRQKS